MDVFCVFDSLNWIKGMEVFIDVVCEVGKIVEVVICYIGDIDDDIRMKYIIDYYKDMVKEFVV